MNQDVSSRQALPISFAPPPLRNSESSLFISSDDALIEYNPLLPGQSSPFKVMVRFNPAMKTYRVHFKDVLGRVIDYEDRRKK
jgi:hypothetical protein